MINLCLSINAINLYSKIERHICSQKQGLHRSCSVRVVGGSLCHLQDEAKNANTPSPKEVLLPGKGCGQNAFLLDFVQCSVFTGVMRNGDKRHTVEKIKWRAFNCSIFVLKGWSRHFKQYQHVGVCFVLFTIRLYFISVTPIAAEFKHRRRTPTSFPR